MKAYYKSLLESGADSDYEIIALNERNEEVVRKVHIIILKQSQYFKSLFSMNGREAKEGVVKLVDVRVQVLDCILKYLYYEAIEFESDQILEVIPATEYFQLDSMKKACVKIFKGNFNAMTLSEKIETVDQICQSPPMLGERVLNNIWYAILIDEEHWTCTERLSTEFLREFVGRCGRTMPQRSYRQLVRWMNADKEKRRPLAKELASHINFNGFTLRGLIDISSDSLFESEAMLDLLRAKKNEESARAVATIEERRFNFIVTQNNVHEFEYCGLQWVFACQIFSAKENDDVVFILRSSGNLAKHFKIRVALLNHLNQVVLEWTSSATLYHGSLPNPSMLEPAKHDGVYSFRISLVSTLEEAPSLAVTPPVAPAAKIPPPVPVAKAGNVKAPMPAPTKVATAPPKAPRKRAPHVRGPKMWVTTPACTAHDARACHSCAGLCAC